MKLKNDKLYRDVNLQNIILHKRYLDSKFRLHAYKLTKLLDNSKRHFDDCYSVRTVFDKSMKKNN